VRDMSLRLTNDLGGSMTNGRPSLLSEECYEACDS